MAKLRVSPGNVPEGGEVSFVLTGLTEQEINRCYSVKITDLSMERGTGQARVHHRFTPRFLDPLKVTAADEELRWSFSTSGLAAGPYEAVAVSSPPPEAGGGTNECTPPDSAWNEDSTVERLNVGGPAITTRTFLQRASANATTDQALWVAIRNRTNALSFDRYEKFIDLVFCDPSSPPWAQFRGTLGAVLANANAIIGGSPLLNIHGPYAYSVLKLATQVFLTLEAGVVIREDQWGGQRLLDLENEEKEQYRLNDPSATFQRLTDRLVEYLGGSNGRDVLPYLNRIVNSVLALNAKEEKEVLPYCAGVLQHRFTPSHYTQLRT
jgi:hypothetical protein